MNNSRMDPYIDGFLDYWMALPLTLTMGSDYRIIRVFGMLCFFPWLLTGVMLGIIPMFALIFLDMFWTAWDGDW